MLLRAGVSSISERIGSWLVCHQLWTFVRHSLTYMTTLEFTLERASSSLKAELQRRIDNRSYNQGETAMIKLKRVLAPVDFSETSEHALRYACEFAGAFGAELHLIHVNEPPPIAYSEFGIGYAGVQDLAVEMKEASEARLNTLPESDWQSKLTVTRSVLYGSPFVEIVRYARDQDIDLIVLGTHGRGAIAHMLMGSTAEKVVRKAPCPVLTVRPEGHEFVSP